MFKELGYENFKKILTFGVSNVKHQYDFVF